LLTVRKPKNARVKRALEKREPQVIENEKTAIFVRGQNTSEKVRIAMKDLVSFLHLEIYRGTWLMSSTH